MKPISRRELVAAAAIVPFSAVRGSAANSAVTVGLIGCGARGTLDAQYLAQVEGARIVALADLFPARIARVRASVKLEDAKEYGRDTELLEKSGVDAVIIATPGYLHPEHFESAVRAKKHIYNAGHDDIFQPSALKPKTPVCKLAIDGKVRLDLPRILCGPNCICAILGVPDCVNCFNKTVRSLWASLLIMTAPPTPGAMGHS